MTVNDLESNLNSFARADRTRAITEWVARAHQNSVLEQETPVPMKPAVEIANMHCHSFFSYNAYGYSPSGLACLAKKINCALMGIVDFDVLDGVDEFLDACINTGVRGSAALESRVFIPEFSTREINSPGEPGVYYTMGIGFPSSHAPAGAAETLADMRKRSETRNRVMVERINAYLSPVMIDYTRDVLPLTPAGNATERHILAAYISAAEKFFPDTVPFWAEKLGMAPEQLRSMSPTPAGMAAQFGNSPKFQNALRAKVMKRGGVGYSQPGAETFPTLETVNQMIVACGAIPCAAWLDGALPGEQAIEELMELLISKGAAALNIIPDRNWNIPDPEVRRVKLNKLYQVVELAQKLDIPLNIGTEMNTYGQKLVDDFDQPELAPVRQAFIDGAYFIYGHTMMQRVVGLGYQSDWARAYLPTRCAKNAFYTQIGRQIPPSTDGIGQLQKISSGNNLASIIPDQFLNMSVQYR